MFLVESVWRKTKPEALMYKFWMNDTAMLGSQWGQHSIPAHPDEGSQAKTVW